ncbi:hypothetical protein SAMN05428982_0075 [Pseudoxanthomonas sp. CF385]|nr:hypothetical protein SAMN05428982_0075 [Pseudoxanthomonas sp. CF385]
MESGFVTRATAAAQAICWWGALFGGGLLLAHFYKIGYLPRFDLASLMGTIAGVAGLGFLFLMVMSMLLVLPGLVLQLSDEAGIIEKMPRRVPADSEDRTAVLEKRKTLLINWAIGSFAAVVAMSTLVLSDPPDWLVSGVIWASMVVWLLVWMLAEVFGFGVLKQARWWSCFHFFISFLLFGTMSFTFLYALGNVGQQAGSLLNISIILVIVLLVQCAVYFSQGEPLKVRAAMVGCLALMLLVASSLSNFYSERISTFFQFGMMRNAELIVTEKGCAILSAAAAANVRCKDPKSTEGLRSTGAVDIWTRVGADTLLSAPNTLGDKGSMRVLLPNEEVLSVQWSASTQ